MADEDYGKSVASDVSIAELALVQPYIGECSNSSMPMLHRQLHQRLKPDAPEFGQALP